MKARLILLGLILVSKTWALSPQQLKAVGFEQNIGQQISGDLTFRNSDGSPFKFGDHFRHKPMLLVLGYYHCPMLCTLINNGLIQTLQELRETAGRDFEVINVSIDAREKPAMAAGKKTEYLKRYGRAGAGMGWQFLTGDEHSIAQLAREAGFHFAYDSQTNEYAHPSGIIVLTPSGRISRYFLGVNIDPAELRQAILAASREESGSMMKRLALLCYHYSPVTGKYGGLIIKVMRGFGLITLCALAVWILFLAGRGRPTRQRAAVPDRRD